MMKGLLVTVYLQGAIGGNVAHTTKQKSTVKLSKGESMTRTILHTDRTYQECCKVITISDNVLKDWESNMTPSWENDRKWKKMTKGQRVQSYLDGFDEGYGISYETLS